ncbi:hypothetical protein [Dehalogenimonas sp. THU2]|uniref:hypothetical protein n=1 Tax=Dehalogenimonas sp. THU2 TaxID=3151121 RepID=UPI00321A84A6
MIAVVVVGGGVDGGVVVEGGAVVCGLVEAVGFVDVGGLTFVAVGLHAREPKSSPNESIIANTGLMKRFRFIPHESIFSLAIILYKLIVGAS